MAGRPESWSQGTNTTVNVLGSDTGWPESVYMVHIYMYNYIIHVLWGISIIYEGTCGRQGCSMRFSFCFSSRQVKG